MRLIVLIYEALAIKAATHFRCVIVRCQNRGIFVRQIILQPATCERIAVGQFQCPVTRYRHGPIEVPVHLRMPNCGYRHDGRGENNCKLEMHNQSPSKWLPENGEVRCLVPWRPFSIASFSLRKAKSPDFNRRHSDWQTERRVPRLLTVSRFDTHVAAYRERFGRRKKPKSLLSYASVRIARLFHRRFSSTRVVYT